MYDYVLLYYEELVIDEDHLILNVLMDLLHLLLMKMMKKEFVMVEVEEEQLVEDHQLLLLVHLMKKL
jgi:hypothetical protein